ncbi:hypothetical protein NQ314_000670 [Rhamnusium bicolor]|uniref:C2H2-type domain-containing protein n=1 Tax=Rhamnusium bicolor TaxID=1586634 RepID=A0AAV8ZU61_9CUCU|nr:hypothetical protein NQ314_000670 [Rhamnusium bicolor]
MLSDQAFYDLYGNLFPSDYNNIHFKDNPNKKENSAGLDNSFFDKPIYPDVYNLVDNGNHNNINNVEKVYQNEQVTKPSNLEKENLDQGNFDSDSNFSFGDDLQDQNFDINDYGSNSNSDTETSESENNFIQARCYTPIQLTENIPTQPNIQFSKKLKEQKIKDYRNKMFFCTFCEEDISSRNFVRHLTRRHSNVKEIRNMLSFPIKSKERQNALAHLRNNSNFNLYLKGTVRPKNQSNDNNGEYYPCIYCKAIYSKQFLSRHTRNCVLARNVIGHKPNLKVNNVSRSQTEVACALDPTNVISKLDVKERVFDMMRGDEVAFVAKKDLLIAHYGESYFKSQKRERKEYTCNLLHPENFDNVISATRHFTGFDPLNKTYKAPSVALHMGTALKVICDELTHLILKHAKGFQCNTPEESLAWRQNVKNFKKLVEARWNTEISSIALKDMNEKRWKKPLLVQLINDVKSFREETLSYAKDCEKEFLEHKDYENTYKLLVRCTLALLILFNRRRIGDVQYLKIDDYKSERKTDFQDFEAALTDSEEVLTQQYKRVINGGKGSRAVVILVPQLLQHFIDLLLKNRDKYTLPDNNYAFAMPKSKLSWTQCCHKKINNVPKNFLFTDFNESDDDLPLSTINCNKINTLNTRKKTKLNKRTVFKEALDNTDMENHIQNGFRKCGLYPFDPNNVDYTKCIKNFLENQLAASQTEPKEPTAFEIECAKKAFKKIEKKLSDHGIDNEVMQELNSLDAETVKTNEQQKEEQDMEIPKEEMQISKMIKTNKQKDTEEQAREPDIENPRKELEVIPVNSREEIEVAEMAVNNDDHDSGSNPNRILQPSNSNETENSTSSNQSSTAQNCDKKIQYIPLDVSFENVLKCNVLNSVLTQKKVRKKNLLKLQVHRLVALGKKTRRGKKRKT